MQSIGQLMIDMAADLARLRTDMTGAVGTVDQAMRQINRSIDRVKSAFGSMFASLAAGLSIKAFAGFIKGSIEAADAVGRLSERTGLAVRDIAGLQIAYKQAGMSNDALEQSMGRMNRAMAEGNKAFEAMGIKVKNADGTLRPTRDVLGDVAEKFSHYQSGAAKAALAQSLFGKSGAEMLNVLNLGRKGLEEYDATAKRLGLTLDQDTTDKARTFTGTMDLMQQRIKGTGTQIAAGLLPTLQSLASEIIGTANDSQTLDKVTRGLSMGLKGLYSVAVAVSTAFMMVGTAIGGAMAIADQAKESPVLSTVIDAASSATNPVGAVKNAFDRVKTSLSGESTEGKSVKQAAGSISDTIKQLTADLTAMGEKAGASINRVWNETADGGVNTLGKLNGALRDLKHPPLLKDLQDKKEGEAELTRIRALIEEEKSYARALDERGAQADKLTAGEKLVLQIQEQLQTSIGGVARANKEAALALAQEYAEWQKSNQSRKEAFDAQKKLIEEIENRAGSIERQAAELDAANAVWGKGKEAIQEHREALAKDALELARRMGASDDYIAKLQQEADANTHLTQAMKEAAAKRINQELQEGIRAAQEQIRLNQQEASMLGLTADKRARINALRKVEIELAKELDRIKNTAFANEADREAARQMARQKAVLEGEAELQRIAIEEWNKTADSISNSLTDAFMRAFDGSESLAKSLRKSLIGMFNSLVLRPTIEMMVRPVGNLLTGAVMSLMGGGSGSSGGGILGLANNASSLYSAYGMATNGYGIAGYIGSALGYGNAAGAGYGTLAYANTVGAMGGDSLGAFIAANNGWQGMAASTVAANAATNTAAGVAGNTMGTVVGSTGGGAAGGGALSGLGAGVLAIPLIVGMLNEMFDNSYERYWGAASTRSNVPGVAAGSTNFNLTTGELPDRDAMIAEMNARIDAANLRSQSQGNWVTGDDGVARSTATQLPSIDASMLEGINDRALALYLNANMAGLLSAEGYGKDGMLGDMRAWMEGQNWGDYYRGAGYVDPESKGWWGDFDHNPLYNEPKMIEASRQIALGIQAPIENLLKTVGQSADDLVTEFGFAKESGKHNSWFGHIAISQGDKVLADYGTTQAEKDYATHWETQGDMMRHMYSAALSSLKELDLPGWAKGQADAAITELSKIDPTKLSNEEVLAQSAAVYEQYTASIANTYKIIEQLTENFAEFSGATQDAVWAVGQFLGGMDNMQQVFAQYVQNYYSAGERAAIGLNQMREQFDAIGVSMPNSTGALREMIRAQDLATAEGQQLTAALLGISGSFAEMMGQMRESLGLTQDSVRGLFASVLQEATSAGEAARLGQEKAGDLFMEAITSALLDSVMGTVMAGIVDPLVMQMTMGAAEAAAMNVAGATAAAEALAVGGTAGASAVAAGGAIGGSQVAEGGSIAAQNMVAGSSAAAEGLAGVVNQAVATINQMTAVFSSSEFAEAYSGFSSAIGTISASLYTARSSIGGAVGHINNYTSAVSNSGSAAERAANQVSDAWRQIGDSLMDEVRRIRGQIAETADQGLAYWEAQFAITTAQARAGDQDAAKQLTSLSGNLLRAAEAEAGSMLDLQRIRAATAQSLQDSAAYAYGFAGSAAESAASSAGSSVSSAPTNSTGMQMLGLGNAGMGGVSPMPAQVAVTPAVVQAIAQPTVQSNQALLEEIRQLREEQQRQAAASLEYQAQIARLLRKWEALGIPMEEEETV